MTQNIDGERTGALTTAEVEDWLRGKIAHKLDAEPADVGVDEFFDSFGLDSTEALVLAGELEAWLGFELETTALWYHPTVAELAKHIVEVQGRQTAAR